MLAGEDLAVARVGRTDDEIAAAVGVDVLVEADRKAEAIACLAAIRLEGRPVLARDQLELASVAAAGVVLVRADQQVGNAIGVEVASRPNRLAVPVTERRTAQRFDRLAGLAREDAYVTLAEGADRELRGADSDIE